MCGTVWGGAGAGGEVWIMVDSGGHFWQSKLFLKGSIQRLSAREGHDQTGVKNDQFGGCNEVKTIAIVWPPLSPRKTKNW